jgi:hypothetical protein
MYIMHSNFLEARENLLFLVVVKDVGKMQSSWRWHVKLIINILDVLHCQVFDKETMFRRVGSAYDHG